LCSLLWKTMKKFFIVKAVVCEWYATQHVEWQYGGLLGAYSPFLKLDGSNCFTSFNQLIVGIDKALRTLERCVEVLFLVIIYFILIWWFWQNKWTYHHLSATNSKVNMSFAYSFMAWSSWFQWIGGIYENYA
jgi:hypothetical protein